MKEIVKSYQVFLPTVWERMLVYLAYPMMVIGLVSLFAKGSSPAICMAICVACIVTVELFFDMMIFGGIGAKDTNKLEYIKTSAKGMKIMEKSLIGDGIRRVLSVSLIMIVMSLLPTASQEQLALDIPVVFRGIVGVLLVIELGLLVVRLVSSVTVLMVVNTTLSMFSMVLVSLIAFNGGMMMGIISVLLCLLAMVGERALIMRRARKSYYDGRA